MERIKDQCPCRTLTALEGDQETGDTQTHLIAVNLSQYWLLFLIKMFNFTVVSEENVRIQCESAVNEQGGSQESIPENKCAEQLACS